MALKTLQMASVALAVAVLSGCATSRHDDPRVGLQAAELTGIGHPFVFHADREPIDVDDEEQAGGEMSLAQAVRLALTHDPAIQSALARVRQAEADAGQTRLLPNPVFSLAVRFTGSGAPDIEAGVAADLLSLLTRSGRTSPADQRLRKATADALTVVLDSVEAIEKAYAQVQRHDARVAIDVERRTTLLDLARLTDARLAAGEVARLDVLAVQAERATADAERLAHQSEARRARLLLAHLIGQPSGDSGWTLDSAPAPAPIVENESAAITNALRRRPELRAIVWELAALGDDLSVARFAAFDEATVGVDAERDGDWSVGPSVSFPLPIFDVGQARRERLIARIIEQRHELTRIERQIVQEVRVACERANAARAALHQLEREAIPSNEQRLDQSRRALTAGTIDLLAVRLAEQDLQSARSRRVELQHELTDAQITFRRATAGPHHAATQPTQLPEEAPHE